MSLSGSFHHGLHVETAKHDGKVRLLLYGEVDLSNASALETELRRAEASDAASIEVDLRHLRFIDPTGVRVFLRALFRDEGSHRLRLLPGSPQVQRTFRLCDAEQVLFPPRLRGDGASGA